MTLTKTHTRVLGAAAIASLSLGTAANATMFYTANLTAINGIGVGAAALELDGNMLTVNIAASGLDAGTHLAHIHGLFTPGGQPMNSTLPDISDDVDGDGFVELAEAIGDYGPIILNMATVGTGTDISFSQSFDLTDPSVFGFVNGDMTMGKYTIEDLIGAAGMSLDLREIIVHGQNAPAVGAGTAGEVDGTAGFKLLLPTLGGEIEAVAPVPEPASWAMLLAGFGLLGAVMRVRPRKVALA